MIQNNTIIFASIFGGVLLATNQNSAASSAPRPRRRKKSLLRRIVGGFFKTIGTLLLIGVCTGAILACFAVVYVQTIIMPQAEDVIESIDIFDVGQSSTMYYTDKNTGVQVEMLTLRGTEDRTWVKYEDIPKDLINATIAIEDKRFEKHQGVDWIRTAAGLVYMFTGQDIQGGSTITQQLIKNVTEYDDVTVKRKILEIFTALEFERSHSKEEILEWYLNYIYLGDGCNGVYTAAHNYFGKELDELTVAECASLISITNNPSIYNPYRYPENNLKRRNLCLEQMALEENGPMITQEECERYKEEPLNLKRDVGSSREQEIFTWYEDQVIEDVMNDMMEQYGISKKAALNQIYYGGLRIETCFDPEVQAYVDAIYNDRSSLELDSKTGQEIQSGITIIDNSTGNVVAVSGGIGEKKGSLSLSRATDTIRPPGSSIKPLSAYAPALDLGLITPATVFDDVPVELLEDEKKADDAEDKMKPWPSNSYNYYKGLTTVHEAVEDSVNTIAVKIVKDLLTPDVSYQFLTDKFGITSLEAGRDVNGVFKSDIDRAPLALGGLTDGVSTYEMAAAYATFANNGMYKEPRTYTKVVAVDINGKETVLLENSNASEVVLKESTVYYINTMLENVIHAGTGHDAAFEGMTIAGKTGTTTSNNDKWFVGYSPYYTAAVWVGYDYMERIPSNAYLAAQMWKKVMEPLHEGLEDIGFKEPENLVKQSYCKDSGMIATEWCNADPRGNRVMSEAWFLDGDQPKEYCTVHVPVEICIESEPVLNHQGNESGVYRLAGEFCPVETRKTIGMLSYARVRVDDTVKTRDDIYLKSYLDSLYRPAEPTEPVDPTVPVEPVVPAEPIDPTTGFPTSYRGICLTHLTKPYDPVEFDPSVPSTWPTNDPNFDIFDRTTWPNYVPPFDPSNPATWPTDDPNFNIADESTWPDRNETGNSGSGGNAGQEDNNRPGSFFQDWFSNWFG